MSADLGAIESRTLAWLSGEQWKIVAYTTYDATGDKAIEPYRVTARRMLRKNGVDAPITDNERQLGKAADLAAGFGGSVGAWRRIIPGGDAGRTDEEIKVIIAQWREAHPATLKFWTDLARAIRITIRTGQPILVAPQPQPPIVASFADGNLTLTLPSGRAIIYPEARLVPSKFEGAPPDLSFKDNARGQWKAYRGWFGTFVENVVQGCARDLLAAAIARFEARGLPVVMHCHDEVTCEVPIGSATEQEFSTILLEPPTWAAGLPLAGKVHSGSHYLEAPAHPAEALVTPNTDDLVLETALYEFIDDARDIEITDTDELERADQEDYVDNLTHTVAPLTDLVSQPLTPDNKVCCPFHDDAEPSCAIYPDHFHCFGCGEHGGRLDWLTRAEGMRRAEAVALIQDWTGPIERTTKNGGSEAEKLVYALRLWEAAQPIAGTLAARYLADTRAIDLEALPADHDQVLRFHPRCPFGPGTEHPCLVALFRDVATDAPVGIHRIALTPDAQKIDRMMLGRWPTSRAIKLWRPAGNLVIGEGIETVLAAATRVTHRGVPLRPAWALGSSGGIARFPAIPNVEQLTILVDHDANGIGRRDAKTCAERWNHAGRAVTLLTPKRVGADFNDIVMSEPVP
jgi:hypothetical protein